MRRSIARRMSESAQAAPVFFTTVKIVSDQLTSLRAQLSKTHSRKVSTNDLIVKACAIALSRHRTINATFGNDSITVHDDIDISVAVALDDGLITPIVRNADLKGLLAISEEIRTLADRAKAGQLSVSDYQGGSFTVSNLGMFGVDAFTAIINPPQSAILAVGAIEREVYLDAGVARDRGVMKVTLTSDHRVIDGAQAARFLATLKELLENPAGLLL
jgi:pyruvate dehydrogenase E2 component (dihydrolipoamide acetyltransferase)